MSYLNCKKALMMFLVSVFLVTGLISADTGYKILSSKGTVMVKKDNEIIPITTPDPFPLKKEHSLMLYKGAAIEIAFPNGTRETFAGPFYAPVSSLQKPFTETQLSPFKESQLWIPLQRIFNEEGEIYAPSRSGPTDRPAFKDEIEKKLADKSLVDPPLPPGKIKELNAALGSVDTLFNAFPEVRRIVIKALVYRHFGLNKKALDTMMTFYKTIASLPDKKILRGQVEDYVYTEFSRIEITIQSQNSKDSPVNGFYKTFSANFDLWWAAFYYNGKNLIELEKTCDTKLHPQKTFAVHKNLDPIPGPPPHCLFIIVCPEWTDLENLDDIDAAKKVLLADKIKETKVQTVKDWGKVTIKLCIVPPAANFLKKVGQKLLTRKTNKKFLQGPGPRGAGSL